MKSCSVAALAIRSGMWLIDWVAAAPLEVAPANCWAPFGTVVMMFAAEGAEPPKMVCGISTEPASHTDLLNRSLVTRNCGWRAQTKPTLY